MQPRFGHTGTKCSIEPDSAQRSEGLASTVEPVAGRQLSVEVEMEEARADKVKP